MPTPAKTRGRKSPGAKAKSLEYEAFERPAKKIADSQTRENLTTAIDWLVRNYMAKHGADANSEPPWQWRALRLALGGVRMGNHLPPALEAEMLSAYAKRNTRTELTARCIRQLDRYYKNEESRQDTLLIDSLIKDASKAGYPIASQGEKTAFDEVADTMLRSPAAIKKRFYEQR